MIGVKAMDEVALHLFDIGNTKSENVGLDGPIEWAQDGLKQIMIVKSKSLLPYLVPHLTEPPVNITALCTLCVAAQPEVLSRYFTRILDTLVTALASLDQTESSDLTWVKDCQILLLSIEEPEGIKTIVSVLLQHATNHENIKIRVAALDCLILFCSKTEADYNHHVDDLIRDLFNLFNETDEQLLSKAWTCLNSIIDTMKGNNLLSRQSTVRQCIRILIKNRDCGPYVIRSIDNTAVDQVKPLLPGFCLPKKGISCLLPIFKEGLLNGTPDLKEQSAQTLSDCIQLSE